MQGRYALKDMMSIGKFPHLVRLLQETRTDLYEAKWAGLR